MYIEVCATVSDRMEIRFDPTGDAAVVAGTFSYGQGHETMYAQMLADWLGLAPERIRVIQGDTDQVSYGRGSFGSRTATVGGCALRAAADLVIERGKRVAARLLEADEADIEFAHGRFVVAGTDRAVSLPEAARATYQWGNRLPAELASGLEGVGHWSASPQNYPNGCYVVEVEVDAETGVVRLDRIAGVDDVGRVINPLLLEGQVHGSIAQGAGQALLEQVVFDETGQLVTGSFTDYAMPRADDFPPLIVDTRNVPTKGNPLGVKGGAETGTVGVPAAVIAAIVDALAPLGVRDVAMPATPFRVWQAIRAAQG
jgi:carbon-monoxide dehydrogenase large subunit